MKTFRIISLVTILTMFVTSCGVHGDPGYVFFSLDWEYYNSEYCVTYYEDDNINVPEWIDIEPQLYYECYPGTYDFYYESEDPDNYYDADGWYELEQISGSSGGLLFDGMDGADTYFDLYLYVDPDLMSRRKSAEVIETHTDEDGREYILDRIERSEIRGDWKLTVNANVRVYKK